MAKFLFGSAVLHYRPYSLHPFICTLQRYKESLPNISINYFHRTRFPM